MRDQFVTYEIAKPMEELGYNESCLAYYDLKQGDLTPELSNDFEEMDDDDLPAPLWQQAIDWLREAHNIHLLPDVVQHPKGHYRFIIKAHATILRVQFQTTDIHSYNEARRQAILTALGLLTPLRYYAIQHSDGEYLSTGYNATSENECLEAYRQLIMNETASLQPEDQPENFTHNQLRDCMRGGGYSLQQQNTPFPEVD